ncbi:MAG: leucine-rich repeat protein, partial [Clostridiales bacterium]|nr:leucine-rich repeat protein [Clostridiales bacterium]
MQKSGIHKKTASVVAILLVCILSVFCASCGGKNQIAPTPAPQQPSAPSQNLEIFRSDIQLTQEQKQSKIKAEYLKKNNGYKDDDEVVVILTLSNDALIDSYLDGETNAESVAAYAASRNGSAEAQSIRAQQNALVRRLQSQKLITDVEYHYTAVLNAVAVRTQYGNFEALGKAAGVQSVLLGDTFNLPQAISASEVGNILNPVEVYPTGIFDSSSVSYTGVGTAVAVLDSGFDCSHSVFRNDAVNALSREDASLWIKESDITKALPKSHAQKTTPSLTADGVWYSNKIPFAYDYADKDADVFPLDSEHGTHVAGIIGGKDAEITGVAVNTQLALMKVFSDFDDGAKTEDILAALEDAVLLNVDAINMSLGSSCGFAREEDGNAINAVYDKINASGISLITAASNSYSSSFGGEQGNTNFVTNPDSSTVGSPSTYTASLSVASISGTKSRYIVANDEQVFFYTESNSITGDPNDFFKELGIGAGESKTFKYVTVPGVGVSASYAGIRDEIKGAIALIRRGDNTFEDKALQAKLAGAAACIIYNNVEGTINMSMGKSDHIPTISVSKDVGVKLAEKSTGTMVIADANQAGPFMSDFSSWGPAPGLEMKPEITAHGGNIRSAVPGGGYDELSGTSMATPNLCGIVVLIRQFLKEKYPQATTKEISVMANQMLMSTASIVRNEEGNPYSPRKQGAGLASLYNVVHTNAYLTVDGIDRTKIELKDDPKRNGVYEMRFNVVNTSDKPLAYTLSLVGMTETVSDSDSEHVAEKGQILQGGYTAEKEGGDGSVNGNTVTVDAGKTLKLKVRYTLTDSDKKTINDLFPYGMYVEGFVKLTAADTQEIDLNIPFLAFFGDWTQAPMFDKTYYEVESEAHNGAIDDEDKIKADYLATTPYGSYYHNYIIPLGTYLYDMDAGYEPIPATEEHIALSDEYGSVDGISAVYGGLLRGARTMTYTITDKVTGKEVHRFVDYNASKAYSLGGSPIPYYELLNWKSGSLGLVNNRKYEFKMTGLLDYGDGGVTTNARNTFSFDFHMDNEAPVIKSATYEKEYDRTQRKDRYYITLTVYDNQYVQSIMPIRFTDNTYTFLTEHPIPVYSEKGKDNVVRFEITDFLDDLYSDGLITSALGFSIDDYALNTNIFLCQLPGTKGEFKFTRDGELNGGDLTLLSLYEDEVVDLTDYLATADTSVDANKDYLKYLDWTSSNESVAVVRQGQVRGIRAGTSMITVTEHAAGNQAVLFVHVKAREQEQTASVAARGNSVQKDTLGSKNDLDNVNDASIQSLRFTYFETQFAHWRAGQRSEIGDTGDRIYISGLPSSGSVFNPNEKVVKFYPGESIKLFYDLQPWYVADRYKVSYSSSNTDVATVDENGVVTALAKGNATITLRVEGSNLSASLGVTVNSEFVIEDRTLVAYKGRGGKVVIPDDEGIMYIGAYAFCLYETDNNVEVNEDDYDANKNPQGNTLVTEVVVPYGVKEIYKYAFYNCRGLRKVTLPTSVQFVREYAFYNDDKLETVNLENVYSVGKFAFYGCEKLGSTVIAATPGIDLQHVYAIGESGFANCASLKNVDLSALRNAGTGAFRGCKALQTVTLTENTKLGPSMFAESGLVSVRLFARNIPESCFDGCESLATVALPDGGVYIGDYAFNGCKALEAVELGGNTVLLGVGGSAFNDTALQKFTGYGNAALAGNTYTVSGDGKLLLTDNGKTAVLAALRDITGDYTVPAGIEKIGDGAFGGAGITSVAFSADVKEIGAYAFAHCKSLATVTFPAGGSVKVGAYAFFQQAKLAEIKNFDAVKEIGAFAFTGCGITDITIADDVKVGDGAFYMSKLKNVTIGKNVTLGVGSFRACNALVSVTLGDGAVLGERCFAACAALKTINLEKLTRIPAEAFYGCRALTAAHLTAAEEIGEYAFSECDALASVTVPKVRVIGTGAFGQSVANGGRAPSFTAIELPDSLTYIGTGAFLGCASLARIAIPASVTHLGAFAFSGCTSLASVTLPASIARIERYTFMGCRSLTDIDVSHVAVFGEYAFQNCAALTVVSLTAAEEIGAYAFASTRISGEITANGLVTLGESAFENVLITAFNAPQLQVIGEKAFRNARNLRTFTFSNDVAYVGERAFYGCDALSGFYRADENATVDNGTINSYAVLHNGVLYTRMPSGYMQLASVPAAKQISRLEVAEGTQRIDAYAGNANRNVQEIILPDSLAYIGNYAFYGYTGLA